MSLVENSVSEPQRNMAGSMSSFIRRNAPKGLIKSGLESTMEDESLSHIGVSLMKFMSSLINMKRR